MTTAHNSVLYFLSTSRVRLKDAFTVWERTKYDCTSIHAWNSKKCHVYLHVFFFILLYTFDSLCVLGCFVAYDVLNEFHQTKQIFENVEIFLEF